MTTSPTSQTMSLRIDSPADEVYRFIADAENLPKWAAGLCRSVRRAGAGWIIETPMGPMAFCFAEPNTLGVLDHYIRPEGAAEIYVPMRVVPSGAGCEVMLTILRRADMSDERFAEDCRLVERDLTTLRAVFK